MTAPDVERLRELLAAATPGWSRDDVWLAAAETDADADLAVAAVNALPGLLDRLESSISLDVYNEVCRLAGEENARLRERLEAAEAKVALRDEYIERNDNLRAEELDAGRAENVRLAARVAEVAAENAQIRAAFHTADAIELQREADALRAALDRCTCGATEVQP